VEARNRRHLVFAVAEQLELLSKVKTWYIDGTFKLVRQPFTQLLTVNAFVRSGDAAPCICIDVVSQKEGLQEGEFFNIYLSTYLDPKKY